MQWLIANVHFVIPFLTLVLGWQLGSMLGRKSLKIRDLEWKNLRLLEALNVLWKTHPEVRDFIDNVEEYNECHGPQEYYASGRWNKFIGTNERFNSLPRHL